MTVLDDFADLECRIKAAIKRHGFTAEDMMLARRRNNFRRTAATLARFSAAAIAAAAPAFRDLAAASRAVARAGAIADKAIRDKLFPPPRKSCWRHFLDRLKYTAAFFKEGIPS